MEATARAELAVKIAKQLMLFPLSPRPGDDPEDYYKCLETSFTLEILKLLNEATNGR